MFVESFNEWMTKVNRKWEILRTEQPRNIKGRMHVSQFWPKKYSRKELLEVSRKGLHSFKRAWKDLFLSYRTRVRMEVALAAIVQRLSMLTKWATETETPILRANVELVVLLPLDFSFCEPITFLLCKSVWLLLVAQSLPIDTFWEAVRRKSCCRWWTQHITTSFCNLTRN